MFSFLFGTSAVMKLGRATTELPTIYKAWNLSNASQLTSPAVWGSINSSFTYFYVPKIYITSCAKPEGTTPGST